MRKIIHIDCDSFFASVEMRDKPELRNVPLAVGGPAQARGVLATCNYPARSYGLHSAMPTAEAMRRCPGLVLLPPRFDLYRQVSGEVFAILQRYSDHIEPVSIDEAYLDVTGVGRATALARDIRKSVAEELGLTVSAGVSVNKFLAKVASDWNKPDGCFVIAPQQLDGFVAALPVEKIPGVGKATLARLHQLGVYSCADLQRQELRRLCELFGVFGKRLFDFSRGIDMRPVSASRVRKSLSVEQTYAVNLATLDECQQALPDLLLRLQRRFDGLRGDYAISKRFLKIRFADFSSTSVEIAGSALMSEDWRALLMHAWHRKTAPVRLLGVGLGLQQPASEQLSLALEIA